MEYNFDASFAGDRIQLAQYNECWEYDGLRWFMIAGDDGTYGASTVSRDSMPSYAECMGGVGYATASNENFRPGL